MNASEATTHRSWSPLARVGVFVAITFVLTWGFEFGVIWPFVNEADASLETSTTTQLLIMGAMFFPAIGMLLTRLITREGMRDAWFKPFHFKRTWKWWIVAWLGTAALIVVGAAVYFLAFPGDFDPSLSATVLYMQETYEAQGLSMGEDEVRLMYYVSLVFALFLSLANIIPAFGEEWGWRGYLVPKLLKRFRVLPTMIISGVIWGLWHLPLTIMGHNYGLGYVGYPILGILAMCWMCCCLGVFFSYLTLRTGSCIPAAIAHAIFNGLASASIVFSVTGGNAFVGPTPTGVLGCIGFTIVAVVLIVSLTRRERAGQAISIREIDNPISGHSSDPQRLM